MPVAVERLVHSSVVVMSSVLSLSPQSSSDDLNIGGVVADPLGEGHDVPLVKGPGVVAGGGEGDPQSSMRDVGLDERLLDDFVYCKLRDWRSVSRTPCGESQGSNQPQCPSGCSQRCTSALVLEHQLL